MPSPHLSTGKLHYNTFIFVLRFNTTLMLTVSLAKSFHFVLDRVQRGQNSFFPYYPTVFILGKFPIRNTNKRIIYKIVNAILINYFFFIVLHYCKLNLFWYKIVNAILIMFVFCFIVLHYCGLNLFWDIHFGHMTR